MTRLASGNTHSSTISFSKGLFPYQIPQMINRAKIWTFQPDGCFIVLNATTTLQDQVIELGRLNKSDSIQFEECLYKIKVSFHSLLSS